MDPITQRILEQQRAIQSDPMFSGYQPSMTSLDEGLASLQAQPGFAFSAPVNEALDFTPTNKGPKFSEIAGTAIKNAALNTAIKKVGLEGLKGNILKGVLGTQLGNPLTFSNPITASLAVGSLLPDNVRGLAGLLRNKRIAKAIARDERRDLQDRINKGQYGSVTPQDARRGNQYEGGGGGGMSANASTGTSAERGAALHG